MTVELVGVLDQQFPPGYGVPVDNYKFVRCRFSSVRFFYSGGPFAFENCRFEGACEVILQGSADLTREFLKSCSRWGLEIEVEKNSPTN